MSNSRRGLLAAGLCAVVAGSMGVVWTLNASADETPAVVAPVVADEPVVAGDPAVADQALANDAAAEEAAAEQEPLLTPPARLPWGARPKRIKLAEAGATSKVTAAAGAGAAAADDSGSLVPEPVYAAKGMADDDTAHETVVPPAMPGLEMAKAEEKPRVRFYYGVGEVKGETEGTWANLIIEKPKLGKNDFHSLAELSIKSSDGATKQAVEFGWNVDPAVNGDSDPHLFAFHWEDGVPQCYNACGFTQISKTVKPGFTLPVGSQKRFGIQRSGPAWWLAYDSEWIGYFHDRNWQGRFTKGSITQWFGEVAAQLDGVPCSEMGNGTDGSVVPDEETKLPLVSRIGSIAMFNGPDVVFTPEVKTKASGVPAGETPPPPPAGWEKFYPVRTATDSGLTFRYGGKGSPDC